MNFDWPIKEKQLKQRVSAILDRDALLELDRLDRAEIPEIRNTAKQHLEKLGLVRGHRRDNVEGPQDDHRRRSSANV